MRCHYLLIAAAAAALITASSNQAFAQEQEKQEAEGLAVEAMAGYVARYGAVVDHYGAVGVAARWYVSPRVSFGPELAFMIGRRRARELTLTGSMVVDFPRPEAAPFFVVSLGGSRFSDNYGGGGFVVHDAVLLLGGGVRVPLREGWYVAPEASIGGVGRARVVVKIGRRR